MGDRAQIAIQQDDGGRVYLYSHWGGAKVYEQLARALARRQRWDDPEYLARIIFCEMIKGHEEKETGFGIGTVDYSDNSHDVPLVVCGASGFIEWPNGNTESFDAFITRTLVGKYTKGPWKHLDGALFSEAAGYHVMSFSAIDAGEIKANTALIEAAPDLLEALELLLQEQGEHSPGCKEYPPGFDDSRCCPVHVARTAIAKAKGEQ